MVNRRVSLRFRLPFVFPLLWGLTACVAVPENYVVDANFAPGIKSGKGGPGPVTVSTLASAANSTLTVLPASVIANGAATIAVTVTLKDASSSLVSGKTVTLASSRGATDTVATVSGTTNASGEATFTVSSSTTGSATLTATDTTDAVVVTQTGKALFLAATPWTDYQAQNFDGASNSGSNTSSVKAAWKDLAAAVATRDGALSNFAYSTSSGWGGDGTTTVTSGADGPYRLIFDGTDDFTSFGTGVNTNADFSFETWVYPSSSGGLAKAILSNGATANSGTATETNTGLTLKQSKAQAGKVELHLGERGYADEVLADSPVAYWRLGETSGLTVFDSSGNGLHAQYKNSPTLGAGGALTGDSSTSVTFNTAGQSGAGLNYIEVGRPAGLSIAGPMTIEAWAYPTAHDGYDPIIASSSFGTEFLNAVGNTMSCWFNDGAWKRSDTTTALTLNAWNHIVCAYDGTNIRAYLAGAADGVPTAAGNPVALSASVYLGWNSAGVTADRWWDGRIDEVAIYNTALTPARIAAHYYAGLKRLTCSSTTLLADSSWYHLAGVFSSAGPTLKLMVNGTQECSVTLAGAAYTGSGNDLRTGRDQSAANSWTGAVSDLRTWASALTNANVVSNYGATSSRFPSFAPTSISGLKLWLKSDAGVTLDTTLGTTTVSAWADQSGQANNAIQATKGNQPTYVANTINGLSVLRFDGASDHLALSSLTLTGAITVFLVFKVSAGADYSLLHTVDAVGTSSFEASVVLVTGGYEDISFNSANAGTGYGFTPAGLTTGYHILSAAWDGTAQGTPFFLSSFDGTDRSILTSGAYGHVGAEVSSIGKRITQNVAPLNGDIAEILIYNSALSDTDRKRVEAYLNSRYSLY